MRRIYVWSCVLVVIATGIGLSNHARNPNVKPPQARRVSPNATTTVNLLTVPDVASPPAIQSGTNVIDASGGGCRLVVVSIGEPPHQLRGGVIRGNGLQATLVSTQTGKSSSYGWSEADADVVIDCSRSSDGIFEFEEYTDDPRTGREEVPFVRRTIRCRDGIATETDRVFLTPETGDADRIAALVKQAQDGIDSGDKSGDDAFDVPMAHLRNIGIGRPGPVLAVLGKITADGAAAESLARCRREVEIAAAATK